MDRHPTLRRGDSDPTESTSSRSRERLASSEDVPPGSPPQAIPKPEESSHSSPSLPRDQSDEGRSHPERKGVRFGPTGTVSSAALHQPLNLAEAKPKRSNFLGSRQHSDTGSNDRSGSADQSPSYSPPLPEHGLPSLLIPAEPSTGRDMSADITESSRPEPGSMDQPAGSSNRTVGGDTDGTTNGPASATGQVIGEMAARTARTRAEKLSQSLAPKSASAPGSRTNSPQSSPPPSPELYAQSPTLPKDMTSFIPLQKMPRRKYGIEDESDSEEERGTPKSPDGTKTSSGIRNTARRLLRFHTSRRPNKLFRSQEGESRHSSGQTTPDKERDASYVSRPDGYRRSVLGVILDLYGDQGVGAAFNRQQPSLDYFRHQRESRSGQSTPTGGKETRSGQNTPNGGSPASSPNASGHTSPKPNIPSWQEKHKQHVSSLSSLVQSSAALAAPGASKSGKLTPDPGRRGSSTPVPTKKGGTGRLKPRDHHVRVTLQMELEDLLARHEYMIKSCKALMRFGAPTHRLEEYMRRSARKLELDGQFLYLPGCMVISFDSPDTRTAEVKIIRENQGVDLAKLRTMHDIYKGVIHDRMSIRDANIALDYLMAKGPLYNKLICIFFYGLASASVGPFAFGARPIDMPIAFVLGAILGYLQLIVSARSESYQNVFEISAAVVTSFAARGFGSIKGGNLFCFSALAQSAIALILPGFIVLSAALELQSRNIVAGSVRMVYAIIYSLFLGFGITIGVAFYGAVDTRATSDTQCHDNPLGDYWKFIFVPVFTLSLCVVNQARLRQMPMMIIIAFAGYVVNYFSAKRFATNAQVANTLGALTVGLIGNLYSRLYHGMSAAAMLPAIFVQVPSGIAASGSLISGVVSANQITSNVTGTTTVSDGTQAGSSGINVNSTVFNVGYTMIQIAVGLTVGLFFSSLLVYPFGKKRSGLFSF